MANQCTANHSEHQPHHHGHHSHTTWNADEYEKLIKGMDYNGPKLVVDHFVALNLSKSSKIMDLAAGTGLVGSLLYDKGYTNIDALDGSADMLTMAKDRNCYKNIITHFIQKDTLLPIDDHTYDHIIMSGALCHMDFDCLPQIIRICKPGGIICWSIGLSEDIQKREPQFGDGKFEKCIESLCRQNVWKYLPGYPKRVNNFALGRDGWVYVMEVL